MIKFLNVQSAFEHYNRMLRGNGPVETRAGYQGDRLYVELTTDIRANLLSARFSKRAPAATPILFSACCRDHDDTGATELTDRICRLRRPVDIPAPPRRPGGSPRAPHRGRNEQTVRC